MFGHNNTAKWYDSIKLKESCCAFNGSASAVSHKSFLGGRSQGKLCVRSEICNKRFASISQSKLILFFRGGSVLALCYYCSFLFEQSETGLKVLGIRRYGFDAEWLREKCGLMEVAPNEFVRGQSVLASVDNEFFFSGILCVFFFDIYFQYLQYFSCDFLSDFVN